MKKNNPLARIAEVIVMGGIIIAFIIPAFSPSDEEKKPQQTSLNRVCPEGRQIEFIG